MECSEDKMTYKTDRECIPEIVRVLRGDKTLKQLAELTGLSLSYLSDIERGRTEPSIKTLDTIFTASGVTLTIGFEATSGMLSEWTYVRKSTLKQIADLISEITPDEG